MGCTCSSKEKNKQNNNNKIFQKPGKVVKNQIGQIEDDVANDEVNELLKEIEQNNNNIGNKAIKENKTMNKNKDEETIKNNLDFLYNSYYNAKTYFYSNDLKEKEFDAIQKCKKIFEAKKLLEEGKSNEINMKELPKEITPEYITGYTKEERKKNFEKIINKLNEEKEIAKKSLEKKIEEAKKMAGRLKKENIEKFKIESKKILDVEKGKIDKLNKDITLMNQILEKEYIPVPDYIMSNEEYKIEKINQDIPENVMRINVSNLTYTKSNPMVVLYLKLDENNEKKKEIKPKNENGINETFDWVFDEKGIRNLVRNKINIYLFRTYVIKKDKPKGESELSLRTLKNTDSAEDTCRLKMLSGKKDNFIDVSVKIRSALIEKEYDTEYRETIKIIRIYPEFKINGDNYIPQQNISNNENSNLKNISVSRILSEIETKKEEIKVMPKMNKFDNIYSSISNKSNQNNANQQINKAVNIQTNKMNINKNNNNASGEKIDRSIFKEEELNDVDFFIDNLNSLKVLKERLKHIEGVIAKIDGRTPRELMQKKIKINVKIKQFESQMSEGEFTPNDYLVLMEQQLKHDLILCKFFKQENEINKAKIVYNRINLLNEEINELKQFIK